MQRLRGRARRDLRRVRGRVGDIVTGIVQQRDQRHISVDLGKIERPTRPIPSRVPSEHYQHNDRLKVMYVTDVVRSARGLRVVVSRTHPNLIKRLFELEVPEIAEGIVEDHQRRPGAGAPDQDRRPQPRARGRPQGRLRRGPRVAGAHVVVNELRGEKIDIGSPGRRTRPSSWPRRSRRPR